MSELERVFEEMIGDVAAARDRLPETELTAFFPVRGRGATGELMIVGRAVNGGENGWLPREAKAAERRRGIVAQSRAAAAGTDDCPLHWIHKWWQRPRGFRCAKCDAYYPTEQAACEQTNCAGGKTLPVYNTARSAFWRVIRATAIALNVGAASDWTSRLIWSDLYKIAPLAGGNPSGRLIRIQVAACIRMLKAEIEHWRPRRVVFLTGYDWAKPFIAGLDVSEDRKLDGLVTHAGRIGADRATAFVVGPHPQGKAEGRLTAEIAAEFAALGA